MRLRIFGVYDGKNHRTYTTVREFVLYELTYKTSGKWFFAHAGGLYDVQYLLPVLYELGYQVEASFSGSSAVKVVASKGRYRWYFLDSYFLIRTSLKRIGEKLGKIKGEGLDLGYHFYAYAPLYELIPYNENDNEILFLAIDSFFNTLIEMGGEPCITIGACAMNLFRREFLSKRLYSPPQIESEVRQSYFASRVEVYNNSPIVKGPYTYLDRNSSFVASMIRPCPGSFYCREKKLPSSRYLYFALVTLSVPEMDRPPLPIRRNGKIYFPFGTWTGWYSQIDIEYLQEKGGSILRIYDVFWFHPCYDLARYAETVYDKRLESSGFETTVYKILGNAQYGKFAEDVKARQLLYYPSYSYIGELAAKNRILEELAPHSWLVEIEKEVPHSLPHISSWITADARKELGKAMDLHSVVYSCDTDGLGTTVSCVDTNAELGGWKIEVQIDSDVECHHLAPKLYKLKGTASIIDGKPVNQKLYQRYRAKSFGRRITEDIFELIRDGHTIHYSGTVRIIENLKRGMHKMPMEEIKKRTWHNDSWKRKFQNDGTSVPYHISEIESKSDKSDRSD
jgi:hypothetical protein